MFSSTSPPAWVSAIDRNSPRYSVATLLEGGQDVFLTLTAAAAALTPGEGFLVIAPFHPVPLRTLLERDGIQSWGDCDADGHWQIRFWKPLPPKPDANKDPTAGPEGGAGDGTDLDELPASKAVFRIVEGETHIDVSTLPPPKPMLEILRFIDRTAPTDTLVIHVPHIPVLLFEDLEERDWQWAVLDDGTVGDSDSDDSGPVAIRLYPPGRHPERDA